MAVAAEGGVVAGLGNVFEAGRNRRLVGERRKNDAAVGRRGMQYDAGFQAGMKPLPCYHERFPDGALTPRDGAGGTRMGSRSDAVAGCFGCAAPAGLTREHPVDRRQQTGDREWLLQEVLGAEAGGGYGV